MGILLTDEEIQGCWADAEFENTANGVVCNEIYSLDKMLKAQLKKDIDYIYNQMEDGRFINDILKEMEKEVGIA